MSHGSNVRVIESIKVVELGSLSGMATIEAYRAFFRGDDVEFYRLMKVRNLNGYMTKPDEKTITGYVAEIYSGRGLRVPQRRDRVDPDILTEASRRMADRYGVPLAESILAEGMREPIAVQKLRGEEELYRIRDGYNRACIMRALGNKTIRAVVDYGNGGLHKAGE